MSCDRWLLQSYSELSTNRPVGMGIGPIPEWTIQHYADRHDLGDLFVRQILMIDSAFVKMHVERDSKNG